jgi:hypothetical protein
VSDSSPRIMSDSVSLSTNPEDREIDVSKPNVAHIGIDSLELEKEINLNVS